MQISVEYETVRASLGLTKSSISVNYLRRMGGDPVIGKRIDSRANKLNRFTIKANFGIIDSLPYSDRLFKVANRAHQSLRYTSYFGNYQYFRLVGFETMA